MNARTGITIAAVTAAALLLCLVSPTRGEDRLKEGAAQGTWTMDYDAAAALAKEKNLPLFLDFSGSDWCYWCKLMDANVLHKKEWLAYAKDRLILVSIDFPRDTSIVPPKLQLRNRALQRQFGVTGYPTFIILDADGKTELGRLGAGRDKTPASFQAETEKLLRFRPAEIEKLVKALTPEAAKAYRDSISAFRKKQADLDAWLKTRPPKNDENMTRFRNFQTELGTLSDAIDALRARHTPTRKTAP